MIIFNYDSFFVYNGKGYLAGTGIKLKQEYVDTHLYEGKRIWPYAYMSGKYSGYNGAGSYTFLPYKTLSDPNNKFTNHAIAIILSQEELEDAIDEIIEPREIEIVPKTKRKDSECPEVMVMWVIYILALLLSFIFVQWYMVWLVGSAWFFAWRHQKLWED